jgi:hypothetical protein
VLYIEQRVATPRRGAIVVAALVATLPLTIPFASLLNGREWGTSTSSVGLVPWVWVSALIGHGWMLNVAAGAFAGVLALGFVSTRHNPGWGLVRITAMLFILSGLLVAVSNADLARRAHEYATRNDPAWIDASVIPEANVAVVFRGGGVHSGVQRVMLREAEFFNRSLGPVYDLMGPFTGGFPSTHVAVDRNGDLVGPQGQLVRAPYVLAQRSIDVSGRLVAEDTGSRLALYRTAGRIEIHG